MSCAPNGMSDESGSLKTPDAIQLAVALEAGCGGFLTNDHRLSAFRSLTVVQLSELEL